MNAVPAQTGDNGARPRWRLYCITFANERGDLIVVQPDAPHTLGLPVSIDRQPTVYLAATAAEYAMALECLTWEAEQRICLAGAGVDLFRRAQRAAQDSLRAMIH